MRLSLSSNHTVQTSFLLCIGKKIKILKMNAYFNSTEWLPRNLYSRKQCTLNLVAIEAQPGMLFNAGFGVFHGLQFSWFVFSVKALFWVYCYIKIIREEINEYYSNYSSKLSCFTQHNNNVLYDLVSNLIQCWFWDIYFGCYILRSIEHQGTLLRKTYVSTSCIRLLSMPFILQA